VPIANVPVAPRACLGCPDCRCEKSYLRRPEDLREFGCLGSENPILIPRKLARGDGRQTTRNRGKEKSQEGMRLMLETALCVTCGIADTRLA